MRKAKYERLVEEAKVFASEGKFEEAANCLESSLEFKLDLNNLLNLAFYSMELGRFARSQELFESLLAYEPVAQCHYGLALLYEKLGRKEDAIDQFEKALALSQEYAFIYFDCAYLYDELKNYEKAKEYYEAARKLTPDDYWICMNLGSIYEKENNNEEALRYFLMAYELAKDKPMVNYNLGVAYSKLQQKEKALYYYMQELQFEHHYYYTYFNLGVLYKEQYKDYEQAKMANLKAIEEDQENYYAWYNLGCCYVLMNDYNNAYDCFLYIYYKDPKLFQQMDQDPELDAFRQSEQYKKIVGIHP